MRRIIILGLPQALVDAVAAQGAGSELVQAAKAAGRVHEIEFINPMAMEPCSNIEMHPNDDWRGKGNRRKRFK